MTDWFVETYMTGKESAEEAAATGQHFSSFEPALAFLKERRDAGAEIVRIMGPHTASDEERRAIVEAGGTLTDLV